MPQTVYETVICPKPSMLRIACSDPRFRIPFRDFTRNLGFKPGQFVPIDIGGGPAALAHKICLPNDFNFLIGQVEFFLGHFPTINKIVIFGHENCGYYRSIPHHPDPHNKEKRDLPRAVMVLQKLFPAVDVQSHYAKFSNADHEGVIFEEVAELAIV